jgi:NTE family protein
MGPASGDRALPALKNPSESARKPPSIGLALGGGAARGFAHVGILQTLHAHGIKPDVITGTSMGAVAGGCYAAGHLQSFSEWAFTLTRKSILQYLDVSLSGSGLIGGMRLARHLEQTLGRTKIESLATRFAAIATEIDTGHEVWLTRGRLVEALRASYSLPGVFAPVRIGKRWLVDGALVNPVPVSAARALDSRMVIAVNLNADLLGRGGTIASHGFDEDDSIEEPRIDVHWRERIGIERFVKRQVFGGAGRPGLATVMIEAYNVMQDRITRARLAGDPPDILISPRLGNIGWFDFHRADEAMRIGAEAAERTLDTIAEAIEALS